MLTTPPGEELTFAYDITFEVTRYRTGLDLVVVSPSYRIGYISNNEMHVCL